MDEKVRSSTSAEARRTLSWLSVGVALQAALTIGHFAHGAHVYEDPSRYHVVAPALIAVAASLIAAVVYAWRPGRAALVAGLPFVAMFGVYHGGVSHVAKLLVFAAGTAPERLEEIFDSPDFAVPNDVVFEVTGASTLLGGLAVGWMLGRLVRLDRRRALTRTDGPEPSARASG